MHFLNCSFNHRCYLPFSGLLIGLFVTQVLSGIHIILDPAGDAKDPGRQLATCSERSITLQFCEKLKKFLYEERPSYTVTLTRTAGETRSQEQRAQIANQLHADLFVHISCFDDTAIKPHLMIYRMAPTTGVPWTAHSYHLIPAHKAHDLVAARVETLVQRFYQSINKQKYYIVSKPVAIYDARLSSIMIPAFTIEFGITNTVPWTPLIEQIGIGIIRAIENTHTHSM